jgi:hypothetical protein
MYLFSETQPSLPSFDHAIYEISLSPISVQSLCRNSSLEPVPPGSYDRLLLSTNPLSVSDVSSLQTILSAKRWEESLRLCSKRHHSFAVNSHQACSIIS